MKIFKLGTEGDGVIFVHERGMYVNLFGMHNWWGWGATKFSSPPPCHHWYIHNSEL